MKGYSYFLDNGITLTEFEPMSPILISVKSEQGNYKKSINDVELPTSLYSYWFDNVGTKVEIVIKRNFDNYEEFRGQLSLPKVSQRKSLITLKASEFNLTDQIEAISSESFNILKGYGISIRYEVKENPSTGSTAGLRKFENAIQDLFGVWYDIYMCYQAVYQVDPGYTLVSGTENTYRKNYNVTPPDFFVIGLGDPVPPFSLQVPQYLDEPFVYAFLPPGVGKGFLMVDSTTLIYEDEAGTTFEKGAVTYKNGVLLKSLINSQLLKLPTPTTVKSAFLFGDAVETGNTWTSAEVNGHVPGVLQMHSVSDIKNPTASNPATIANISLGAILNTLKNILNCYTFKDKDGYFRIEHVSYKRTGTTRDVRGVGNTQNPPDYEHTEASREKKILFQAVAAVNDEYTNTYIEFSDNDADPTATKTNSYDSIITDFQAAIDVSDTIPTDGILLIDKDGSNNPTDFFEFPNILANLWIHEANYSTFKIKNEGAAITAESLAYTIKHEQITIPLSSVYFKELDLFQTYYEDGDKLGEVESATINTQTNQVQIDLKFEK